MMAIKTCDVCGTDISDRGNRAYRCEECQEKFRKTSHRQGDMPVSARGGYWQYWKHLTTMKDEELMYLFGVKKKECKHEKSAINILKLRTEMKLIGEAFRRRGLTNGF